MSEDKNYTIAKHENCRKIQILIHVGIMAYNKICDLDHSTLFVVYS